MLDIDSDRVILRLGTVFRLESIKLAPDGVWYAKIRPANMDFRLIKEQFQFHIEVPLSWLTYGNYLYFLRRSQQAKAYFEYLLDKLPPEHTDRSSIYNNMALIYAMQNDKTKAEKTYDEALKFAQSVKSDSAVIEYKDQTCIINPIANVTLPKTNIDRSTALGNIADIYYHKGDYKSAVEHYRQALESSTDLQYRSYFQQMIETLRKFI
ncbi:unnamed protein product [Rotaria sordida]|uniref:Tetratricopeptide repeat protein n=1 Tax=Rotaria sordida TaxID=392033 RepID=A0A819WN94_9BILA|nr:unnamed protein product [Rotaria sordida]CAF4126308.1 unnamed protein product [Rotaria sordida]